MWTLDVRTLDIPFGRQEYKFIVDGKWEPGPNRILHSNRDHLLEPPSDLIRRALIQSPQEVEVYLAQPVDNVQSLEVDIEPNVQIATQEVVSVVESGFLQGYWIKGRRIMFIFDEQAYDMELPPAAEVYVAGNFNGWNPADPNWRLQDKNNDGRWTRTLSCSALRRPPGAHHCLFKFVVNKTDWLSPPEHAVNATPDGQGNVNLRIDPDLSGSSMLRLKTQTPLDLRTTYLLNIYGITNRTVYRRLDPGEALDRFHSEKALGVALNRERRTTTYRLFAPRAQWVDLCIYNTHRFTAREPGQQQPEPAERYPMWRDPQDGVWEITLRGLDTGRYYSFNLDGPAGDGEGFNAAAQIGDPYARAAAHAENNTIVIDPEASNRWFGGWTDQAYQTPPPEDAVIYEMHVRDMTIHPSSGTPPALRGTYEGLLTGETLPHLLNLGINTVELLPVAEFNNGTGGHNWGYTTVYYFAPEGTYSRAPTRGAQYYEFKNMVNAFHNKGLGVILDVVYNHVGSPNIFQLIDRKYFFRLNADYSYMNFSGCGNDVRTEAPMMRRLIVDNIAYWMTEHHVDGFRLDLAELIDMDTMHAIRDAARAINPNVLLIAEPWSLRGENKHALKGTGWSAWNNDFRYAAKDFIMGKHNRDWLIKNIFGSMTTWAQTPVQAVNYLESHDDMALADELCTRPDRDGRHLQALDAAVNRLGATILFTSLGIPMLAEGQEFLRSKRGHVNTYDKGDDINAIRWTDRERPLAAKTMAYYRGLIHLRMSDAGRAFRLSERPENNYYRWLLPDNPKALAYVVNMEHTHPGHSFIILLNADSREVTFDFTFPRGRNWIQIGNGEKIVLSGIPDTRPIHGGEQHAIRVPAIHSAIFMDADEPRR
jgi:pullulanase/glycogen debranching enzyme